MNKTISIYAVFNEFLTRYPKHFSLLFLILLFEGSVAVLSILAVVPLADFMLDSSLTSPSRITEEVLIIFGYLGAEASFWWFGLLFVGLNVFRGILEIIIRYSVFRIKYAIILGLISETLRTFFKARWTFFSLSDHGRLLNTFNKELNTVGDTLGYIATMLAHIIQCLFYLIVPFLLNAKLTITALVLAIIFGSPFLLLRHLSYRLGKRNTNTANVAMRILNESLYAARLILGFGRQKHACDRYIRAFEQHIDATVNSQTLTNGVSSLFKPMAMFAAVVAVGLSFQQDAQIPEITAVLWSLLAAFPILTSILQANVSLKNFLPSYEQLAFLREQAAELKEIEGEKHFQNLNENINFKDVNFTYSNREKTLNKINLNIIKGKMTALVGESGSGKSTITDILLGLQIPDKGEILLDNIALSQWNQNSFRECVGYVPQEPFLFHTSIRENLIWSYEQASEDELWEACRLANAEEFIKTLPQGIETVVGDRGVRLSGGQRQRIALARALLRKPELLILDEATSSLDTDSERKIQHAIDLLAGKMTLLVVAHRLSTIANADMIYVLKEGRMVEQGQFDELLQKKGIFARMVHIQSANEVA